MIDLPYTVKRNWLPADIADRFINNYPIEYIKEYCSNPDVSEHESSLYGNYSAPAEEYDSELFEFVRSQIPSIMIEGLGAVKSMDHFYLNFHYDVSGAWIEPHNDLKDFRWRITNQIYLNNNQGARLLDRKLNIIDEFPCEPNVFYNIVANPWSWHDVPELESEKKSLLFRIGKRNHRTVAHPVTESDTAYVIYNNFHRDSHYAKLGVRMGNITEAWLHHLGAKNIHHSGWRCSESLIRVAEKALEKHKTVHVLASGYLPDTLEKIKSNGVVQTLTHDNNKIDLQGFGEEKDYYRITDDNIGEYAEIVFGGFEDSSHPLAVAERVMSDYYARDLQLNYEDL